ncbi:dephospho-CoA kinase [uncultured Amnibacterium sp.]|uniref:dephospho-CoA kinase n=1 Tax=uncultured Amnibacterium sp. TaxID=1631851 RepID=UPI0035CBCA09
MPLIAVTGGIASGKSTVAARLAQAGAVVVDADLLAREAVAAGSPGLAAVRETFGPQVFAADGTLDRAALGRVVFADPAARERLNGIVHPAVIQASQQRFAQALSADPAAMVVYDVPLIDARGVGEFDRVVVADAPAALRIERLVALRGMTRDDAQARVRAQLDDDERRAFATDLIDTGGSIEHTLAQTDALAARLAVRPATD